MSRPPTGGPLEVTWEEVGMPVGHFVGRRPTRRRAGALAAAVLAASLALTGCTTFEKTRTAAFVNGSAISDATVAQVTSQFNDNLLAQGQQPIKESQVLGYLILSPFVLGQVRKSGSWTPDARYNSALARVPNASDATKDFLATSIVLGQGGPLTQQDVTAILDDLKKAEVDLDPRYGTWDPETGGFVAPQDNWIKPTAAPTGDATPNPSPTQEPAPTSTGGPTGQ